MIQERPLYGHQLTKEIMQLTTAFPFLFFAKEAETRAVLPYFKRYPAIPPSGPGLVLEVLILWRQPPKELSLLGRVATTEATGAMRSQCFFAPVPEWFRALTNTNSGHSGSQNNRYRFKNKCLLETYQKRLQQKRKTLQNHPNTKENTKTQPKTKKKMNLQETSHARANLRRER